jgi:hypothetical protein
MTPRTRIERADAQAGTDDAGTPRLRTLLVALLGSAAAWSIHFLASYALMGYACAIGWTPLRPVLLTMSVVALGATAGSGWLAWRQWHVARAVDRPTDDAWDARMGERTARVSFLMVVGLASAILFGIGILMEAVSLWMVPVCEPGGI